MSATPPKSSDKPSAAARAEAAAWVARLHGPNRTREVEAGFRRWLAEDPERAAAFELLTDIWEKSASLRRHPTERVASWQLVGFRISLSRAAVACLGVAVLAVVGTLLYLHTNAVTTAVGEQRTLALEDGTRVYLNTNSRAVVHYDKTARRVELQSGEAFFAVAKRPDWPFIVTAGDRQIRALGTAFIVRHDDQDVAVTLVEGKVTVTPVESEGSPLPAHEARVLTPGQRLTFAKGAAPRLDRPPLDKVTAWQRGQVAFDSTPLADAVADMNRYSTVRLVIEAPEAATIRISGIFRAGDSVNFAQAVAKTYRLRMRDQSGTIVLAELTESPTAPPAADVLPGRATQPVVHPTSSQ
jgi:transmembrane sensor